MLIPVSRSPAFNASSTACPPGYFGNNDGCTLRILLCHFFTNHGEKRNIQPKHANTPSERAPPPPLGGGPGGGGGGGGGRGGRGASPRTPIASFNLRSYASRSSPFTRSTIFTGTPALLAFATHPLSSRSAMSPRHRASKLPFFMASMTAWNVVPRDEESTTKSIRKV